MTTKWRFVGKVTFVCWMNYFSKTYLFLADRVKPFHCQCRLRRPSCWDNKGREDKLKCRLTSTFRRTMGNIQNGYVWIKKQSNMKIYKNLWMTKEKNLAVKYIKYFSITVGLMFSTDNIISLGCFSKYCFLKLASFNGKSD